MSKIRKADWGQVQAVKSALEHLLQARWLLRYADAPKTLERTLLAISSCKGALRHAGHRAARTEKAHVNWQQGAAAQRKEDEKYGTQT